ncbi:MAG: fused MFS/spermidine synthase [Gaiellales bacterium]
MAVTVEEPALEEEMVRPAVPSARLGIVVFTAGGATLATEIAASRLLAPYFGSSTIVWANIIGLILLYLSVGYWLGGKIADRRPEPRVLGLMILAAAAFITILPFISRPILDLAIRGLDAVSAGAMVGSFFAALALFAIPVTLLGAVSPFAIRLAISDVRTAGSVAGRLYALSTIGSILGTFVAAIVTIPLLGTQRTMVGAAALLAVAAVLLLGRSWLPAGVTAVALLALPAGSIKPEQGLLYETESAYQYIQVVEDEDGWRALKLNEGVAVHSLWRPDSVLTGSEWDMFLVLPPLLDRAPRNLLVIGNSGATTARAYGRLYPEVAIDGVEIDAEVTEAGRRFLGVDENPKLRVITADGRPFLRETQNRYDLIAVDAYRQPYIPFYLTTKEFFELARSRLAPGGMIALNIAAVPGDDRLGRAIGSTMAAVFPHVFGWRALRFNELLIGTTGETTREELARRIAALPPELASLGPPFANGLREVHVEERPLTDDRAPVEWLTDGMLIAHIARSESLDEEFLPTRPR